MRIDASQITGGVLAGGQGRRLGGIDKGWYVLDGAPLIETTITRLRPQVGSIVISANRSLARYRALGCPVMRDHSDDAQGPLAGVAALLQAAHTPWVLVVPVDTPYLPLDLAARLSGAVRPGDDMVLARAGGRLHPLHMLLRRDLLDDLQVAISAGTRRVTHWQDTLASVVVDWESADYFVNINRPEDAPGGSIGDLTRRS